MMHFLFTTVALHMLNAINLIPFLERSETYDITASSSRYHVVMFHEKQDMTDTDTDTDNNFSSPSDSNNNQQSQSFMQAEGIDMICASLFSKKVIANKQFHSSDGNTEIEAGSEPSRMLQDYIHHRRVTQSPSTWIANHSQVSCTLYDHEYQLLILFGDTIGSLPLWYEIQTPSTTNGQGPQVFVSSLLLIAAPLGFNLPTPVGPGLTLIIDMSTPTPSTSLSTAPSSTSFEVLNCQHWSDGLREQNQYQYVPMRMTEAEQISSKLLESTSISLSLLIDERSSSISGGIITELDMHDDSSVLLECALHGYETTHTQSTRPTSGHSGYHQNPTSRLRFNTQPLIADQVIPPEVLSVELQGIPEDYT